MTDKRRNSCRNRLCIVRGSKALTSRSKQSGQTRLKGIPGNHFGRDLYLRHARFYFRSVTRGF